MRTCHQGFVHAVCMCYCTQRDRGSLLFCRSLNNHIRSAVASQTSQLESDKERLRKVYTTANVESIFGRLNTVYYYAYRCWTMSKVRALRK